jgi:hypothetical protein
MLERNSPQQLPLSQSAYSVGSSIAEKSKESHGESERLSTPRSTQACKIAAQLSSDYWFSILPCSPWQNDVL